jgi:CCR4-NOT complex subunit CAF16
MLTSLAGLNLFPTHVLHMRFGAFVTAPIEWHPALNAMTPLSAVSNSSLHALALQWLKDDKLYRKQEEARGNRARTRGARRDQVRC